MNRWHVNVGDGDSLIIPGETLAEVEKAIIEMGYKGMINAVVRAGHETYLAGWSALRVVPRMDTSVGVGMIVEVTA